MSLEKIEPLRGYVTEFVKTADQAHLLRARDALERDPVTRKRRD